MNLLYSILISITTLMLFMNHPLAMGLMILMQTLLISLMIGFLNKTYWFSYILILTFLGGMLILFIYMTSIASNEMFKLSLKMIMLMFLITIIYFMMWYYLSSNKYMSSLIYNNEMSILKNNFMMSNSSYKLNLLKLYNNQFMTMMMMLILYLLICLIAIVKIINNNQAPFRANN